MNIIYYSLNKILTRDECEKILKDSQLEIKAYNNLKEICNDNNCNYILNITTYPCDSIRDVENQLKLIECQKDYELVPNVYDIWYSKEENDNIFLYTIMEKLEGDLTDFINIFVSYEEDKIKILLKSFILTKLELMKFDLKKLNKNYKICLQNLSFENIFYKKTNYDTYELLFANFTTSSYSKEIAEKCIDNDIEKFQECIEEFRNTFLM